MSKKKFTFASYIDEVGIRTLAEALQVGEDSVRLWKTKKCDPRVDQMRRIKILSKGRITYDLMIDHRGITTGKKISK